MKMGLCVLLLGHVNFLLGALMHGVVLRHVGINKQAGATGHAIANVVALASGLVVSPPGIRWRRRDLGRHFVTHLCIRVSRMAT